MNSGEPEPGPASSSSAAIAVGVSSSTSAVSLRNGIGSSGSWCRRTSEGAGTIANVSISGASARSGSITAGSPWTAPSIITIERPRIGSGMSGSGGSCMIRNDVVTCSGASTAHAAQAFSTRSASVQSQIIMPA